MKKKDNKNSSIIEWDLYHKIKSSKKTDNPVMTYFRNLENKIVQFIKSRNDS